ncbi:ABC-2 family transporter protein [Myxococcota bacterium]|nr:ABC-2 family transporter protein [Myxococcota bacterium]
MAADATTRPSARRYLPIIAQLFRASVSAQAQYRFDFLLQLGMAFFWVAWNVAPVWLVFEIRPSVAGWHRAEAMLVMSTFLMLRALIEGIVSPNLTALVSQIRMGTFDFVLLKPIDSQVLVSFSKAVPAKAVDFLAGFALSVWAILQVEPAPSFTQLAAGLVMLAGGAMTIYGIWLLISCTAFWFVKVDNLTYLFSSIFDAARWPIGVFRGWVRVALTFVIPVAVMTSYPALAVLGLLELEPALVAWVTGLALLGASRLVWRIAIARYSSASS